jgi:hypothetical protein
MLIQWLPETILPESGGVLSMRCHGVEDSGCES